ncbi:MAG TPA: molybdenum cofactor guanylyltransferase, partial [Aggregatilineales bacterium]|nr:molybdenum cofactor guanylyltransferase [Aggregatilineales bacterium]
MHNVEDAVTVAVLAGGASRRMGADKSLAELAGKPLIQHVLACVQQLNMPVVLVTDKPEQFSQFQIEMVSDILPGNGSLGGIYSALMSSTTPFTLCVACDMPYLNVTLLTYLLSLRIGFDAVVPMINNQPQGLHAIYHRRAAAPIRDLMNRNELRISGVFDHLRVRLVGEAAIRAIDPELRSFTNLNTPEELARLRREFEQNAPSDTD